MKGIVLCADDYGQEEAISKGILSLAADNRLSAISCMVTKDDWPEHASWLQSFKNRLDIGLHFNLTEGKSLTNLYGNQTDHFRSLTTTLLKSQTGRLNIDRVEKEFHAQVERFKAYLGDYPRFIDGHQHVHQFPCVREAIIRYYRSNLNSSTYIRWVNLKLSFRLSELKKWIIHLTGTVAMGHLLKHYKIPHNHTFSGCYDFNDATDYQHFFTGFLTEIEDRGLIMCHPGLGDSALPIMNNARKKELEFLASEAFLEICEKQKVVLSRF